MSKRNLQKSPYLLPLIIVFVFSCIVALYLVNSGLLIDTTASNPAVAGSSGYQNPFTSSDATYQNPFEAGQSSAVAPAPSPSSYQNPFSQEYNAGKAKL